MKNKLQEAIECLTISDLYVRALEAKCSENFDPKHSEEAELVIQTKHMVTKSEVLQNENEEQLFRIFVEVGVKWSETNKDDNDTKEPLAYVEAEFVAEYAMKNNLSTECLDAFALNNVSYHVWPYWRELLTSQCDRMRLPRILLPMTQIAQNQNVATDN